ncbi:hypothetical protein SAMN02927924_04466 [Sphingobium faniae]|nr:hypothetical protein SAMN02927924_04466 [Sphingobium faniae]
MQAFLTVLINPVEGRDADFNDWYTHVHIRDVMRFAGSVRVQRLVASEIQMEAPSHRYFTLYDTFDPALLSREHRDAMGTRRMVVTHAHDKANVINGYYYPIAARTNAPTDLTPDDQPLILEQIDVPMAQRADFEDWYAAERMPALLTSPAHVAGMLLRFDPAGQMLEFDPVFSHIALWRVANVHAALASWRNLPTDSPLSTLKRKVGCFEPMAPYLTRDHVLQASDELLEIEEAARRRAEASAATTGQPGVKWR